MSSQAPVPKPAPGTPVLKLPNLGDDNPGASFVKRAVGWTLGTLAVSFLLALLVSIFVEIDVTVKGAGALEPVRIWPVRAQASGTVREVLVETGDTVQKGAEVLRLDALELQSTLGQLQAQHRALGVDLARSETAAPVERRQQGERVAQSDARVVTARATLRQRMIENDLGSNLDSLLRVYRPGQHVGIDLAVGEVRAAEAERRLAASQTDVLDLSRFDRERKRAEQAQLAAQMDAARERMRRLVAMAPTQGVVLTEQIEKLPGSFVREGDLLVEVADLGEWRATLFISEREVHKIRLGDSVQVEVQAFSAADDEPLRGSVLHVASDPAGSSQSGAAGGTGGAPAAPAAAGGSGLYRVVVRLDAGQLKEMGVEKFRRGYTVEGKIVTRRGRIIKLLWEYMNDKVEGRA